MFIEQPDLPARARFLGLGITPLSFDQAVNCVSALARKRAFVFVVTPNVDHVVRLAREGAEGPFHTVYRSAALRLCDSRILALLARLAGEQLPVVAGSDLTARLFDRVLTRDEVVAVVGGTAALHDALQRRYPALHLVPIDAPMGLTTDAAARTRVVERLENVAADYVFLAVGAPQSEMIAAELAARGRTGGVGLCIGASLEFITGLKVRAPLWMQRARLEWLHRLASEPRRLWRRYLVEGPAIFAIVLRWRLTGRPI